jgi:sulfite exporter TauE/SafE
MLKTLLATAFLMGVAGGPHCVVMCGAACTGIACAKPKNMGLFHLGRLVGYALLGLVAASSVKTIGWLGVQSAALRPLWSFMQVAALVLGLVLFIHAKQPLMLDTGAKKLWRRISQSYQTSRLADQPLTPLVVGMLWAFMPCGLLYSAVMVAGLTAEALDGAWVMMAFAVGSSLSLMVGPWLWFHFKNATATGEWGIRLAGLALAATSSWALWMSLFRNGAPWCVTG